MKKWVVGAIVLSAAMGLQARVWTNSDGKSVDAELVRVMDGKAYLRPAGKKKLYPFEISSLSQSDRDYIDAVQKQAEQEQALTLRLSRSLTWHTDYNDALAEAEETGYPILFLYTAPSWCGWCRVLENNVLVRDASRAFGPAFEASPSTIPQTIFWLGQMISHTFKNMNIPIKAPTRM